MIYWYLPGKPVWSDSGVFGMNAVKIWYFACVFLILQQDRRESAGQERRKGVEGGAYVHAARNMTSGRKNLLLIVRFTC